MNVYDKAHDLANALKDSEEVKEINSAMNMINKDPEGKAMLNDFRKRQMELQQQMMTGEMPAPEEMEKMEKEYEVLSMNLNVRRLFDSERRLSVIIEDMNKIITDSLQHLYDESDI
ncbi:YlbF family regulator [Paenibacillus sp. CMAA1364]